MTSPQEGSTSNPETAHRALWRVNLWMHMCRYAWPFRRSSYGSELGSNADDQI